jgi:5-oxoprolinase (ATP-hydrolysing)
LDVPVHERDALTPGQTLEGPALIFERHSATVIEAGWNARVDEAGGIVLRHSTGGALTPSRSRPEAVRLELFINRFRSIAADMGERLCRTAVSTNIKERLDFSCALLDAAGELVVNAPHIPVHLGAVGMCVRRLLESLPMGPGDVVVTNHPSYGGSHLPDTTVVTPAFDSRREAAPTLLGFVASRAHHAEIGGTHPGSMPPSATRLSEEAVVIPPTYILRRGRSCWEEVRRLLGAGPFPSRAIEDNLSDLRAAVAANHAGVQALSQLSSEHGPETVRHYMAQLTSLAEKGLRQALRSLPCRRYEALERLDDGSPLRVQVLVQEDRATIDFTGSADVHAGNLNATPAIVNSAVIYTLRLLLRDPLPLNEGLMRAVSLRIPRGILNPGFEADLDSAPAITGGNVETSQRLVDTLLKAFGLAACSQGTMNNVIFGTERFGYYETLGGGSGAGPGFHGASAVHTHMTNTRITDPEVIEIRYPVRVERFALRLGSGGAGRYRGGDGVVRQLLFLERMTLSILSQHRTVSPYGLEGGAPGQPGAQRIVRASGEILDLGSIDGCEVRTGDRLHIETPGGGGYGSPPDPAEG